MVLLRYIICCILILVSAREGRTEASKELNAFFDAAAASLERGEVAAAAETLSALSVQAGRKGYASLPAYSFRLLEHAARIQGAEPREGTTGFLVRRAAGLSPNDPRVLLRASSFYKVIGRKEAFSLLVRAFSGSGRYPSFLFAALSEVLLLLMTAAALALLTAVIIQLGSSIRPLLDAVSRAAPFRYRGYAGPPLLLVIILVPLIFGLFPALCVWSLVLAKYIKRCRWTATAAGALVLAYGFLMPVIERVSANASSDVQQMLEQANAGGYSLPARSSLERAAGLRPEDPVILSGLGLVYYREGLWDQSFKAFRSAVDSPFTPSDIVNAALINMASVDFRRQKFQDAKRTLEQVLERGQQSFELLYNLAQVSMALTEVNNYNMYYDRSREAGYNRWNELKDIPIEEQTVQIVSLSNQHLSSRMFKKTGEGSPYAVRLWKILFSLGSSQAVLLLGCIVLVLGLSRGDYRHTRARAVENDPHVAWCLIPGGVLMAGERPVLGAFILSAFLTLGLAAAQSPIRFQSVEFAGPQYREAGAVLLAALVLLSAIWALAARIIRRPA